MQKTEKLKWLPIALAFISFIACNKDDDNECPCNNDDGMEIAATSYTDWVYFSFAAGGTVTISDTSSSLAWDLAFLRNHMRTNSGSSGPGQGGALISDAGSFEALLAAPTSGYTIDDTIQISDPNDPTRQAMIDTPGNTVLETWGSFNTTSHPPVFTPSNNIYVIKTADGKYVKAWFKSYYSSEAKSAHITMQYFYQSDGTTKLE
ncbi:MAG: HmuY family protein [Bacteroidales bacterium]|nr:HmuY family protein [Bacteroidales bacterium]